MALGARGVGETREPCIGLHSGAAASFPAQAQDNAEAIFSKIDAERPGSKALLDAKALRLVEGATSAPIPSGRDTGVYLLLTSNQADAFLTYCSGSIASAALARQALASIEMPPDLMVRADYGVIVITGARPNAQGFVQFLFTPQAQAIFVRYGFPPYDG